MAKATAAKKTTTKKTTTSNTFMKPLKVSDELAAIVGKGPMPRTEVVKNMWVYIKKHKLQNSKDKRCIDSDEKLAKVFGTKKTVSMFEMAKLIGAHLS